jgi:hypothetical protein
VLRRYAWQLPGRTSDDGRIEITGLQPRSQLPGGRLRVAVFDRLPGSGARALADTAQRVYLDRPGIFDVTLEGR